MRICLLSAEYAPRVGGLADYTRLLADGLHQRGEQVAVLTTAGGASDGEPFPVFRTVERWHFGLLRALRQVVDRWKPDVLDLQFQTAAYDMHPAIMLAPRLLRRPHTRWVTTFHDVREPYLFPKAHLVRRWLLDGLAGHTDGVVATNGADARRLERVAPPGAMRVIPIGSNVPGGSGSMSRADLANRWGVPVEGYLLGFFGLMNHSKGFEVLLRALRLLRDRLGEVHLLVVGERTGETDVTNAAYLDGMAELAQQLGVADRVHWTGRLALGDVAQVLRGVDAGVLPFTAGASYRHGTLLAMLANGVPLVTTTPPAADRDSNGPLPALTDGRHCLLTPPGNPDALAAACVRLLQDALLRRELSAGALALAANFSWERIVDDHLALYRALTPKLHVVPA